MRHVILGAGPAGVIAAETIRKHNATDEVVIVGEEREAPYSRMAIPYLLHGNIEERGTYLRQKADHYDSLCIEYRHGRAGGIDSRETPSRARSFGHEMERPPGTSTNR